MNNNNQNVDMVYSLKGLFSFDRFYIYQFMTVIHALVQVSMFLGVLVSGITQKSISIFVARPFMFIFIRFVFEMWMVMFSINNKLQQVVEKLD